MIFQAATALPYVDRERAAAGLRGQLRLQAMAAGMAPDWSTLAVQGPVEVAGAHRRIQFQWQATVATSDRGCSGLRVRVSSSPLADVLA